MNKLPPEHRFTWKTALFLIAACCFMAYFAWCEWWGR